MMEYMTIPNLSTAGIVGIFIVFMYKAHKVRGLYNLIEQATKDDDPLAYLSKTKLASAAQMYIDSISIEITGRKQTNTPALEIFSEFNTCSAMKINLRTLDAAAGTLVGLGLLGTFLGLTLGIKDFDSSSTQNIQNSIQLLLNGMGTAFLTSLVGMLVSMLYTVCDKYWRNKLSRNLYVLTTKLDAMYYIDDRTLDDLNEQALAKSISNAMREVVVNEIKKIIESQVVLHQAVEKETETIVETLNEKLTYRNESGETATVGNAIREILTENQQQSKALKSFSTDLAIQLSDGFDRVLDTQMQQKILPLMENVDATTKSIIEHIDKMANQVSSPATEMIQSVVDELKRSMSQLMGEFRSGLSGSTTNQLEMLTQQLNVAAKSMADFPTNMENITNTLQVTINEVKTAVSDISNTSANANSATMQKMQEQISLATGAISNAIKEVKDVMNGITNSSQEQNEQMINKLSAAADKMGIYLTETTNNLSSQVQDSIKDIVDDINRKQTDLLTMQEETVTHLRKTLTGVTQDTQQQSSQMVNNLTETANQLRELLTGTVSSLSSSMQQTISGITDDVNNKQADLIALQEQTTTQTRKLLETFNHGLDRLERMNEYIQGTMNMFQQAQGEITGSTAHLQTITGDMKLATQLFNKGQSDYSTKMEEIQHNSQRGIDALSNLLKSSGDLSKDYVDQFELIKAGLSSIFQQLQNGLAEYSRTVQTTTQAYLNDYSRSLKETAGTLASAIERQNEVVESLVDALEKNKKR